MTNIRFIPARSPRAPAPRTAAARVSVHRLARKLAVAGVNSSPSRTSARLADSVVGSAAVMEYPRPIATMVMVAARPVTCCCCTTGVDASPTVWAMSRVDLLRHPLHSGHLTVGALKRHRDRPVLFLGDTTITGGELADGSASTSRRSKRSAPAPTRPSAYCHSTGRRC